MDFRSRVKNKAWLARKIGCNRTYLSLVLSGKRGSGELIVPSVGLAKRIEAATDGAIRWTEFFEAHSSAPEDPQPTVVEPVIAA